MSAEIGTILILVVQFLAFLARISPKFQNAAIPKIVYIGNFVILLAGYAKVVVDALGQPAATLGLAGLFDPIMRDGYSLAGFGGFLRFIGSAALASILTALQKWIYDNGTKPAIPQGLLDAGKS